MLAELDAKDAALRETAWWIAGRHPQWGDQLAGYFQEKLKSADKLKPEERDELAGTHREIDVPQHWAPADGDGAVDELDGGGGVGAYRHPLASRSVARFSSMSAR